MQRLLEIKPTIEIDSEYRNFLDGKYDKSGGLKENSSSGNAESIATFLKGRGEKLEDSSSLSKFIEKFK